MKKFVLLSMAISLMITTSFTNNKRDLRSPTNHAAIYNGQPPVTINPNLYRAEVTLGQIFKLYPAGHDHLFIETFPYKEQNQVTYLAGADTVKGKRVAYLWPTSGIFSGVNALLKSTGN